ncbi:unnamed protein product, partial [Vitis vinifera]|uniref:Uncharacterized protein n=1 Tax=Vitis vinifera TaxID=29760 RepID=D7TPV3_VITVI
MKNKERGREVEERSIWCPVFSLVPRFFSSKKTSQLLPVFFLHLAAALLPLQCMCCPPKSPPMHVLPRKNPMHVLPGFFPFSLPLAAAPFLLFFLFFSLQSVPTFPGKPSPASLFQQSAAWHLLQLVPRMERGPTPPPPQHLSVLPAPLIYIKKLNTPWLTDPR